MPSPVIVGYRITGASPLGPDSQPRDDRFRLAVAKPISQSYRFWYQVHGE